MTIETLRSPNPRNRNSISVIKSKFLSVSLMNILLAILKVTDASRDVILAGGLQHRFLWRHLFPPPPHPHWLCLCCFLTVSWPINAILASFNILVSQLLRKIQGKFFSDISRPLEGMARCLELNWHFQGGKIFVPYSSEVWERLKWN